VVAIKTIITSNQVNFSLFTHLPSNYLIKLFGVVEKKAKVHI
jgi:hypothetical protein